MARQETEGSRLNRDAVIEAALAMLDTVGVDGLSMRALADRLGVKAASLYWHLRDKDQLLELVAESVLDRVVVPDVAVGVAAAGDRRLRRARPISQATQRGRDGGAQLPAVVQRSRLVRELARSARRRRAGRCRGRGRDPGHRSRGRRVQRTSGSQGRAGRSGNDPRHRFGVVAGPGQARPRRTQSTSRLQPAGAVLPQSRSGPAAWCS